MSGIRHAPRVLVAIVLLTACQPVTRAPSAPPTGTPPASLSSPEQSAPSLAASAAPVERGSLVRIGSMSTMRAAHTATLLPEGRILIAGGCTEHSCEGITATTELLDPSTGSSTPGPDMSEPRVGHTAATLPDGRILLIGGFGERDVTPTTDVFDPATNTIAPGLELSVPRADAVTLVLEDGSVLVAGGYDGGESLASAEILAPGATAFAPAGSMATPRSRNTGVLLDHGRVLVLGGSGPDEGDLLASAEIFDPAIGTWSRAGDMTVRRHKLAAVTLDDGRVLVLGGSDERDGFGRYRSTELYDPAARTFTAASDMAAPRYKHTFAVVRLVDGRVLVAGGAPTAELFDPATGAFETVPGGANADQSFSTAVVLPDGSVVVAGGYDQQVRLTDQVLRFVP